MMSAPKYQYGHKPTRRRPRKALFVFSGSVALIAIIVGIVWLDLRGHVSPGVEGESRVVSQVLSDSGQKITIDEPTFTMELPGDWKEISRNENNLYNSINWQASLKGKDNRYLTVYIDRIPFDMPVNRLVAVKAQGSSLTFSDVSDNCANFTVGGTFNVNVASGLRPTITKWNKVDFLCNLPRVTDNQIGTGAEGTPNSVTVAGPTQGGHKYFFLYTDRNSQPDYGILYDALSSFRAK